MSEELDRETEEYLEHKMLEALPAISDRGKVDFLISNPFPSE